MYISCQKVNGKVTRKQVKNCSNKVIRDAIKTKQARMMRNLTSSFQEESEDASSEDMVAESDTSKEDDRSTTISDRSTAVTGASSSTGYPLSPLPVPDLTAINKLAKT